MSYTVVPDRAAGDAAWPEADWDTYLKDNLNNSVPRLLGSTVLGSSTTSITFSSIPGTHRALLLVAYTRVTAGAFFNIMLRFNGDTGANYDWQDMYAGAAAQLASQNFAQTSIIAFKHPGAGTGGANLFGAAAVWIPGYAYASANKTCNSLWSHKDSTVSAHMAVGRTAGFWRSNSAITSLTIQPITDQFATGTIASLYAVP